MRFSAENGAEVQAAVELANKYQLKWMLVDPRGCEPAGSRRLKVQASGGHITQS